MLEMFDKTMQDMALSALSGSGTEVILKGRVKEVTGTTITVAKDLGGGVISTETISCGMCVWAAGNSPLPISLDLIKQQPETAACKAGRILVDPWQRMVGVPDGSVFSIGDCCSYEEGPLPQTAQVAGQQGAYVARLLNREADVAEEDLDGYAYGYDVQREIERGVKERDPVAMALAQRTVPMAKPFEFLSFGILAYIGNSKALAQVFLFLPCSALSS